MRRQAEALSAVLKEYNKGEKIKILDAACGIGTQTIGLAQLNYEVAASDISEGALIKAAEYAAERNLEIDFRQADMRQVDEVFSESFEAVIACDNSIPHLLSDADILAAFKSFHKVLTPEGMAIISLRDYANLDLGGVQVHPRLVHDDGDSRILLCDVWDFKGDQYSITIYLIFDKKGHPPEVKAISGGQYYPVTIDKIQLLFQQAGFSEVTVLREAFFQPLIVARKTAV